MKISYMCSIIILILSISAGSAFASHPFEGRCFTEERSLQYWVDTSETILVGKAEDVNYYTPFEPSGAAACWARFKVQEWLKGSGPDEIWVRVAISAYGRTTEDFESLKYCEFKKDNSYIIYGRHIHKPISPIPPEWIAVASDKGAEELWHCPPHEKIQPFGTTIGKIHNILEQGKYHDLHSN